MDKIVTSFSEPGARVVLLAWPAPYHDRPTLTSVNFNGVTDHTPGTEPDPELANALHAVERLGRTASIERIPIAPQATEPASRPLWADLVDGSGPTPATVPTAPSPDGTPGTVHNADLIITSLRPEHSGARYADLVALAAARLLRVGGVLAVLTHCDWTTGELTDPTGVVVTAGQNADLLYLQHIVALHTPIHDGNLHVNDSDADDGGSGDMEVRARHRALVRGLPAPHQRIHSDVLVFAQPHDHQPPTPLSTDAASHGGDAR